MVLTYCLAHHFFLKKKGKFLPSLSLEPRILHKTSPTHYHVSQGLRWLVCILGQILIRAKGLHLKFHVSGKGGQDMEVSHLVFAYDTIILYDATKEQMELLELDIDVV